MSSRSEDSRSTEDRRPDSEALAFGATEMQRFTTPRHNLHLCLSAGSFQWRIGAINKSKLLGEPMSELDVFGFIGMNRSVFSTLFLCGVLMPLAVVVVAYLFRHFSGVIRGAAMISALIGVVMLTFFTMGAQNAFFMMLSTLSEMAGNGSEMATTFLNSANMPIGETINPPGWMMALSLIQVVINLVLTVYVFLFAKWDNS